MRIGIDARLWNETGVGRYIRNLIKNLQMFDRTNEYVLFLKSDDLAKAKNVVNSNNFQMQNADIHWHSFEEQILFPKILNKAKLDLVHFPYFSLPIFYRRPYVVTIHDLIIFHTNTGKASTLPVPLYYLKRLAYRFSLKQIVNNAGKIIVPLNAVKNDLIISLNIDRQKIAVTPEGVDDELIFKNNIARDNYSQLKQINGLNADIQRKRYFLYIGNAYPHKNLDTLITACGKFSRQTVLGHGLQKVKHEPEDNTKHPIKLLLVGKEDYFYKKIKEKLAQKDYHNIEILHNLSDKELQILYQNALAVVAPSFIEGFGLVPLEAMSNNCLVIASDIAAHREVCQDAAIYFDPRNADSLTNIMNRITAENYYNRSELVRKGNERVKKFSWNKTASDTLMIYEQFKK